MLFTDDSDEKPAAAVAEVKQPSVEREKVVAVDLTDIGPSVRQRSPPHGMLEHHSIRS